MRISNRAVVYFDKISVQKFNVNGRTAWGVSLDLVNSGATPAKYLKVVVDCPRNAASEEPTDPFSLFKWDDAKTSSEAAGPKQVVSLGACDLSEDDILAIQNGVIQKYVIAEARYEDELFPGKRRVTQSVRQIFFSSFIKNGSSLNWNTQTRGQHNCTDDNCPP